MPIDYVSGLGKLPDPMGDINRMMMQRMGMEQAQLQNETMRAQLSEAQRKQERVTQFETAAAGALKDPTAANISNLMITNPEYADEIKKGWDIRDGAARQTDLTQLGEIYSAGSNGRYDLAAKAARRRYDADVAAGQADESDLQLITALESGDPAQQKAALGMVGVNLAAATGIDHFGTVYGALNKGKDGFTLQAGDVRYDSEGKVIVQSPYLKDADGAVYERTGNSGGAAGGPATSNFGDFWSGFLKKTEGGYADRDGASGAPVNFGVNQKANPDVDVKSLTEDKAVGILDERYWKASGADKLPPALAAVHGDTAVNMGVGASKRLLVKSGGDPEKYLQLREARYRSIGGKDLGVWLNRNNALREYIGAQDGAAPAASNDAPPGYRRLTAAKRETPPSGFRWTADGNLEKIEGGPADTATGAVRMTPAEVAAEGLPPGVVYYRGKDGKPEAVSGQDTRQTSGRPVPPAVEAKAKPLIDTRDAFERLSQTWKPEFGGYTVTGSASNWVQGKFGTGPEGQRDWWADFKSMDNVVRNDLFGSALTVGETAAYKATTISQDMAPSEIKKNLDRRLSIVRKAVDRTKNFMVKNKFDPDAVEALFAPLGGAAPVTRIRSVQEYSALPKGTAYIDPQGNRRMKR